MDDSGLFATSAPNPSASRPLLGQTILVVEDSRYACDAMRLMCLHSGARIRRADCLKSARRHLQIYRPSVIVVDMGLPDGNGADLIEELAGSTPRIAAILGTSGDECAEHIALAAGADGFLAKPLTSVAYFQQSILELLPGDSWPTPPYALQEEYIRPDPLAYQDDIAHIADVLADPREDRTLDYAAQFLRSVARDAEDYVLADAAQNLATSRAQGGPAKVQAARLAGLVQHRLERREAI
ncbi:MAG: response regulator [Ruegeria sp.]